MPADVGSTYGGQAPYTAEQSASETSQAGKMVADDAPVDVNMNAIFARSQAFTVDLAGKEFEAAAARRTILADKGVV